MQLLIDGCAAFSSAYKQIGWAKQRPAISLAGAPTLHQEGPAKSGKVTFYLDQYDALHAGTNYLISFGFPTSMPAKQRTKIVTAVLSSWQWS